LSPARVTIRLDFPGGRQLGHGKVRLLELIEEHGSISSAARAMKMSYRRAWLLMDEVNSMFREPVIETQLGGKGGGHARLTEFGKKLVGLYRGIEKNSDERFASDLRELSDKLTPSNKGG
jgi:molybdate transport system regulatory protein